MKRCVSVWIISKEGTTLVYHKGSSSVPCYTSVTIIVLKGIKSPLSIKYVQSTQCLKSRFTPVLVKIKWILNEAICISRMFSGCNNKCERILMHQRRSRGNVSKTQEVVLHHNFVWLVSSYKFYLISFSPIVVSLGGVHYNNNNHRWESDLYIYQKICKLILTLSPSLT